MINDMFRHMFHRIIQFKTPLMHESLKLHTDLEIKIRAY